MIVWTQSLHYCLIHWFFCREMNGFKLPGGEFGLKSFLVLCYYCCIVPTTVLQLHWHIALLFSYSIIPRIRRNFSDCNTNGRTMVRTPKPCTNNGSKLVLGISHVPSFTLSKSAELSNQLWQTIFVKQQHPMRHVVTSFYIGVHSFWFINQTIYILSSVQ